MRRAERAGTAFSVAQACGVHVGDAEAELDGFHRVGAVHAAGFVDEAHVRAVGDAEDPGPALVDDEGEAEDLGIEGERGGEVAVVEER